MSDTTPPLADTKSTRKAQDAPADETIETETAGEAAANGDEQELGARGAAVPDATVDPAIDPLPQEATQAASGGIISTTPADDSSGATGSEDAPVDPEPSESGTSPEPTPADSEPTTDGGTFSQPESTEPSQPVASDEEPEAEEPAEAAPSARPEVTPSTTTDGGTDFPASASSGQAYGSGEPITDPGSPLDGTEDDDAGTLAATVAATDGFDLADDDDLDESNTGALSADAYYGEAEDLPEAPDPEADGAVATLPTSTFPQATDRAAVRQPPSGIPANAYIEPGYRYGGVPIVDVPATEDLKGGTPVVSHGVDDPAFGPADDTEPLGEEKRTARVHELEDEKRDQVNASTLDPDAGDTAAPQADIDEPAPVGTPYDVIVVRKPTSYVEVVAELGLSISFIELAAANGVVNQRYELFPGDRIRIPKPATPSQIDGVDYDTE